MRGSFVSENGAFVMERSRLTDHGEFVGKRDGFVVEHDVFVLERFSFLSHRRRCFRQ